MSMKPPKEQQEFTNLLLEFNSRPDHLIAIVKQRLNIPGNLGWLHIAVLEPRGDHVLMFYHPPPEHKEVRLELPLDPPAKGYEDATARLLQWRRDALAHFKPPAKPVIDYYSPPSLFPYTAIVILLESVLLFALLGWGHYANVFREKIVEKLGLHALPASAAFAGFMHFLVEPAYMLWLTRRHKTPFASQWKWIVTTAALGFAAINEWNECLEHERMSFIYSKTDVGKLPPRVPQKVSKEKKDL